MAHNEVAPDQTTPQGTQAHGVLHGHEDLDVNFRALFGWFFTLGVVVFIALALLRGMFLALMWVNRSREVVASPVVAVQSAPPLPRLIPNPIDNPYNSKIPLPGPWDVGQAERDRETKALEGIGLVDAKTGQATIPDAMINAVIAQGAPAANSPIGMDGGQRVVTELRYSESSGGTAVEDSLH